MTRFFVKDAEAAVYAIEAAVSFVNSVSAANHAQAALDFVAFVGWVKNAF